VNKNLPLDLRLRSSRRVFARRQLKLQGIKAPKFLTASQLVQYWADLREIALEGMRASIEKQ
jgi:hypothetical protein